MSEQITKEASTGLPDRLEPRSLASGPETVASYAELTADFNPIHLDPDFAAKTPFGGPILHGTIGLSLLTQAIEATFGDAETALEIRFLAPAPVGARLTAGGERLAEGAAAYLVYVETDDKRRVIEGQLRLPGTQATPPSHTRDQSQ